MALVLVVHMRAQEGKEDEAVGVMRELAEATRQEPGCIHYIPVQDRDGTWKIEDGEIYPCLAGGTDSEGTDIDAVEVLGH